MRVIRRRRLLLLATVVAGVLVVTSCSATDRPTVDRTAASAEPAVTTTAATPTSTLPTIAPGDGPAANSAPSVVTGAPTGAAIGTALAPVGLPGVNDPVCTSDHRPVVLLHGTFSTVRSNFTAMASALQATGRCVYGVDYGFGGLGSVRTSAAAVTTFIDDVLDATGADQVDVVAFSQGGLLLRTALRFDELAPKVATAVLIAPSFHGSTANLLNAVPPAACPACVDQAAGSPLLAELAAGGDLDGDVRYAVVSSADDTVVTPVASQVPQGPPDRVTSVLVQDVCPGERLDHVTMPADVGVIAWTIDALDNNGAPQPSALTCR